MAARPVNPSVPLIFGYSGTNKSRRLCYNSDL